MHLKSCVAVSAVTDSFFKESGNPISIPVLKGINVKSLHTHFQSRCFPDATKVSEKRSVTFSYNYCLRKEGGVGAETESESPTRTMNFHYHVKLSHVQSEARVSADFTSDRSN